MSEKKYVELEAAILVHNDLFGEGWQKGIREKLDSIAVPVEDGAIEEVIVENCANCEFNGEEKRLICPGCSNKIARAEYAAMKAELVALRKQLLDLHKRSLCPSCLRKGAECSGYVVAVIDCPSYINDNGPPETLRKPIDRNELRKLIHAWGLSCTSTDKLVNAIVELIEGPKK